jgi:hypothetical protein
LSDLSAAEQEWHSWIVEACRAVDVDPSDVDVAGIHDLTKEIAHGFARPMAPVGSYILGLAVGARAARGERASVEDLTSALRETFPGAPAPVAPGRSTG